MFSQVVQSLVFAEHLMHITDRAIIHLQELAFGFNGVHLRTEHDYVQHPYLDHGGTSDNSLHCLEH